MPIKADETKKCYTYENPSEEVLFDKLLSISNMFNTYLLCHGLDISKVKINYIVFRKLLLRVDKRREYYLIFHDGTAISDLKETALLAYWIIKFKPFVLITPDPEEQYSHYAINEGFASFIIFSAADQHLRKESKKGLNISLEYSKRFMYGMRHWDISKEALILISESLCL